MENIANNINYKQLWKPEEVATFTNEGEKKERNDLGFEIVKSDKFIGMSEQSVKSRKKIKKLKKKALQEKEKADKQAKKLDILRQEAQKKHEKSQLKILAKLKKREAKQAKIAERLKSREIEENLKIIKFEQKRIAKLSKKINKLEASVRSNSEYKKFEKLAKLYAEIKISYSAIGAFKKAAESCEKIASYALRLEERKSGISKSIEDRAVKALMDARDFYVRAYKNVDGQNYRDSKMFYKSEDLKEYTHLIQNPKSSQRYSVEVVTPPKKVKRSSIPNIFEDAVMLPKPFKSIQVGVEKKTKGFIDIPKPILNRMESPIVTA